ncbi:MAG: sulfurtransferase TusA [Cellvibrionaceae bacterium]
MTEHIDSFLDTSGLLCPEPVMLLHKSVRNMNVGDVIEVLATDPSTTRDIPKFCHFLGHELLSQNERSGEYKYLIKKNKVM